MWKIKSPTQFRKLTEKMQTDISDEVIFRMKLELQNIKSYYRSLGETFAYDYDGTIFSNNWSTAIVNQGREPGSYAPRQALLDWVKKYKNPGGSARQQYSDMMRINRKLFEEGIEPNWYVDEVLFDMEQEHE